MAGKDVKKLYEIAGARFIFQSRYVTADGIVNIADLIQLASFLSGTRNALSNPLETADVTGDGNVNLADLISLARALFRHAN